MTCSRCGFDGLGTEGSGTHRCNDWPVSPAMFELFRQHPAFVPFVEKAQRPNRATRRRGWFR